MGRGRPRLWLRAVAVRYLDRAQPKREMLFVGLLVLCVSVLLFVLTLPHFCVENDLSRTHDPVLKRGRNPLLVTVFSAPTNLRVSSSYCITNVKQLLL